MQRRVNGETFIAKVDWKIYTRSSENVHAVIKMQKTLSYNSETDKMFLVSVRKHTFPGRSSSLVLMSDLSWVSQSSTIVARMSLKMVKFVWFLFVSTTRKFHHHSTNVPFCHNNILAFNFCFARVTIFIGCAPSIDHFGFKDMSKRITVVVSSFNLNNVSNVFYSLYLTIQPYWQILCFFELSYIDIFELVTFAFK